MNEKLRNKLRGIRRESNEEVTIERFSEIIREVADLLEHMLAGKNMSDITKPLIEYGFCLDVDRSEEEGDGKKECLAGFSEVVINLPPHENFEIDRVRSECEIFFDGKQYMAISPNVGDVIFIKHRPLQTGFDKPFIPDTFSRSPYYPIWNYQNISATDFWIFFDKDNKMKAVNEECIRRDISFLNKDNVSRMIKAFVNGTWDEEKASILSERTTDEPSAIRSRLTSVIRYMTENVGFQNIFNAESIAYFSPEYNVEEIAVELDKLWKEGSLMLMHNNSDSVRRYYTRSAKSF